MKELFKPFRQEDMSYERRFEGNGIGLALAKKCCNQIEFDFEIEVQKMGEQQLPIILAKGNYLSIDNNLGTN